MPEYRIKRIYDPPSENDGVRWLVDRLWPRGISNIAAKIDYWAQELTPSTALRHWFHAHPDQLDVFASRYRAELQERESQLDQLLATTAASPITLVTSTKDVRAGHAAILKAYLEAR